MILRVLRKSEHSLTLSEETFYNYLINMNKIDFQCQVFGSKLGFSSYSNLALHFSRSF